MRKPSKVSELRVTADPFAAIEGILDATVFDEHKKTVLLHNLKLFKTKMKEAQNGH